MTFHNLRREYERGHLLEPDMAKDPLEQFRRWFDEAQESDIYLADAMALATTDAQGHPNIRTVVLRGFDARGFTFYSNYGSEKARELAANPHAVLHFHWNELERQIKIRGIVDRTTREEAEEYWNERPRSGQIGACASPQSRPLRNREELDLAAEDIERRHKGKPIPCPPDWGGYRLAPALFEFWQGRESRLHDRLLYVRSDGDWVIERIAP